MRVRWSSSLSCCKKAQFKYHKGQSESETKTSPPDGQILIKTAQIVAPNDVVEQDGGTRNSPLFLYNVRNWEHVVHHYFSHQHQRLYQLQEVTV